MFEQTKDKNLRSSTDACGTQDGTAAAYQTGVQCSRAFDLDVKLIKVSVPVGALGALPTFLHHPPSLLLLHSHYHTDSPSGSTGVEMSPIK